MTDHTNDPVLIAHAEKRAEELRNKISRRLRHIASRIERDLKELQTPGRDEGRPIFALFVNMAGAAQYIGNGDRGQIKQVVGSVLQRWDNPAEASLHKPWHEKTEEEKQKEKDNPV